MTPGGLARIFRAGFLFCGLGAGARGFLESRARLGDDVARFVSVGGVDIDAEACADFLTLTGSPAVQADVATMTPGELRQAWGERAPDAVFLSPPCKGYSALLSKVDAAKPKYQALNRLVLQGIFLLCETWPDAPPATIILENVPRITSRGAEILAQTKQLLHRYGYLIHEGNNDCGEIGGLGQHRIRYLLVARRPAVVPAFIYRPPRLRVKGCGEILERVAMPLGAPGIAGGPMHALPKIAWLTWVRLSLIPPGGDWRDLPGVVQAGHQRRAVWSRNDVRGWTDPARVVAGDGSNGGFGLADPRPFALTDKPVRFMNQYDLRTWDDAAATVTGATRPGSGGPVVADPRVPELGTWRGSLGVTDWEDPAACVRGRSSVRTGPAAIADPRLAEAIGLKQTADAADSFSGRPGLMGVGQWDLPAPAVTAAARVTGSNGTVSVADPRTINCTPRAGHFRVLSWEEAARTVTAQSVGSSGQAIADPRAKGEDLVIRSRWDCWHRPMTTLERALLQGLPATLNGAPLVLAGSSSGRWNERIGNAVPVGAGRAIGDSILAALLAGALGTWTLGSEGVWVRQDGRSEHEWRVEA